MALPISQIANILATKNYEFKVYVSPEGFQQAVNSLNACTITTVYKRKFEKAIPTKLTAGKKGIYVFTIEELGFPHINFTYLLYIGRTIKTNTFKGRFYKYRNSIDDPSAVENVMLLTNLWPNNTYVYFFEMTNDSEITQLEKILIHKLQPDFNEAYFTTRTVESQSLYKLANP